MVSEQTQPDESVVDGIMQRHGLSPNAAERAGLVGAYPLIRRLVSHPRIPEIRYAEVAPVYVAKFAE